MISFKKFIKEANDLSWGKAPMWHSRADKDIQAKTRLGRYWGAENGKRDAATVIYSVFNTGRDNAWVAKVSYGLQDSGEWLNPNGTTKKISLSGNQGEDDFKGATRFTSQQAAQTACQAHCFSLRNKVDECRHLHEAVDSKLVNSSSKDLYRRMGDPYEVLEYVFGKAAANANAGNARECQVFLKALAVKVNSALQNKDALAKHVEAAYKAGEKYKDTGKLTEAAELPKGTERCNQCGGSGVKTVSTGGQKTSTRGCDKCEGNGFVPTKK